MTAASPTGGSGPTSKTASRTASASTPRTPSGTETSPTSAACAFREGGQVLLTIELDRGCFACALGGEDRRLLFLMATEWSGPANMFAEPRTGQVLMAQAPTPGAGWP